MGITKIFLSERYRLFGRWKILLLAWIVMIGFLIEGLLSYSHNNAFAGTHPNIYEAYLSALGSGAASFWVGILPLVACLISADSLAWDRRNGFLRFILTRTSKRKYILGKITSISIFTGLFIGCGLIVVYGLTAILFPDKLPPWHIVRGIPTIVTQGAPASYVNPYPMFLHNFFFRNPGFYSLIVSLIVILSSIAWASVSLLLSLFTTNIYLVLAGPWILYIISSFILSMPFVGLVQYSPLVLSGPFTSSSTSGVTTIIGYWIVILVIANIVTYLKFHWRSDIFD